MKTWFSNIFCKDKKSRAADGSEAVPPQASAEQTIPADTERTVLASAPADLVAIHAAEVQVAAEWQVGDVILDLYEVKHLFEGGGMGLVYRVHHRGWNTDLAVKSPRRDYFKTETQKENFSRECETWINLGLHPHIVSCHYVRTLGGIPRVFAEYVEGGTLKEWIDTRKLYEGGEQESLKRILDVAIQMAWGLHYAHEQGQGLVHQDVKPANVLMMPDGTAKITDFGLAKARAASEDPVKTGAGRSILVSSVGMTPAYCSPEQANKQELSRKTDIWSWTVSVLEMFVGEVCWQSGTAAPEVLKRLSEIRVDGGGIPEPPAELLGLLAQCFTVEPSGRPENFCVVADRLKRIYHTLADGDYPREFPEAVKTQADSLNNRAVSLLDLGRIGEAEKSFDRALAMDSGHPQATYNRGLHLRRNGRLTDDAIVNALEQSQINRPNDWNVPYLLGLVHLERQDAEGAVSALLTAEKLKDNCEIQRALAAARSMKPFAPKCLRTFEGNSSWVRSVMLSADGCRALSGGRDKILRLWDASTGKCLRTFEGHTETILSVALSANGRWALSGSMDRSLRLWDVNSGQCVKTFEEHRDVQSVALTTDGRWAFSGGGGSISGSDNTLRLWDVSNGNCLRMFEGHTDMVASIALSVDGRWALSGSHDNTLRLWEVQSGKCLRMFEGHTGPVWSVAISVDGRWALSGSGDNLARSHDNTLRVWEVGTGRCLRILEGHKGPVVSVALSADGRWALSGSSDKTLRAWEMNSGKCLRTFDTESVQSVALSADGHWVLSGSMDGTVRLWQVRALLDGHQALNTPFSVCRLGSTKETLVIQKQFQALLSSASKALSEGEFARAWSLVVESKALAGYEFSTEALDIALLAGLRGTRSRLRNGWCRRTLEGHTHSVNSVAFSPDGRWALSGSRDKTLRFWEVSSGKCLKMFEGHTEPVWSVALTADGRSVLSGGRNISNAHADNTLRLWDVSNARCIRAFEECTDSISSIAVSADGRWVLSGGFGHKPLRLWDISSGRCVRVLKGTTGARDGAVESVALSADGCWALSGGFDTTVRLWKLSSGKCIRTFKGHWKEVESVALSADGQRAISAGGWDHTLRVWEVRSGKCLRTIEGRTEKVSAVALSADGRWAFSGNRDGTLRLWDVSTGECIRTFEGHTNSVTSVALSLDGRWALSGSEDKTIRLWELEWDYDFPEQRDWDDGSEPFLDIFLSLHCAVGEDGFSRVGKPAWTEGDFQNLLVDLQYRGYGWLRPEGVRRQLEKMAAEWQVSPPHREN